MRWFSVEDVSDLWPTIKNGFEERFPLKRAYLNNKTRNPVPVDNLPAELILTTDARLRSRFPHEQYLFWFREPYATIVLITCEVRRKLLHLTDIPTVIFGMALHAWATWGCWNMILCILFLSLKSQTKRNCMDKISNPMIEQFFNLHLTHVFWTKGAISYFIDEIINILVTFWICIRLKMFMCHFVCVCVCGLVGSFGGRSLILFVRHV